MAQARRRAGMILLGTVRGSSTSTSSAPRSRAAAGFGQARRLSFNAWSTAGTALRASAATRPRRDHRLKRARGRCAVRRCALAGSDDLRISAAAIGARHRQRRRRSAPSCTSWCGSRPPRRRTPMASRQTAAEAAGAYACRLQLGEHRHSLFTNGMNLDRLVDRRRGAQPAGRTGSATTRRRLHHSEEASKRGASEGAGGREDGLGDGGARARRLDTRAGRRRAPPQVPDGERRRRRLGNAPPRRRRPAAEKAAAERRHVPTETRTFERRAFGKLDGAT